VHKKGSGPHILWEEERLADELKVHPPALPERINTEDTSAEVHSCGICVFIGGLVVLSGSARGSQVPLGGSGMGSSGVVCIRLTLSNLSRCSRASNRFVMV
jgi:hypothetical protein